MAGHLVAFRPFRNRYELLGKSEYDEARNEEEREMTHFFSLLICSK